MMVNETNGTDAQGKRRKNAEGRENYDERKESSQVVWLMRRAPHSLTQGSRHRRYHSCDTHHLFSAYKGKASTISKTDV